MYFEQTRLPNGLQVLVESNPAARSVAVGFFVRTGARDETAEINGVSHFLEHMMFKGTARRTAFDVNREFDEIGAKTNAFTGEELTAYYAPVLPEYLPEAMDLLSDMLRPSLLPEDFEVEKKVILEEIGMYEDEPDFYCSEIARREHFGEHPLGNSVLGTTASVGGLRPEQMRRYFEARYAPSNLILAATGRVDPSQLRDLAARGCSAWSDGVVMDRSLVSPELKPRFRAVVKASVVQEYIIEMAAGPPAEAPESDRFAVNLLATVVGDHNGSRMFWALVHPGIVESADMRSHQYAGAGTLTTFICCEPENAQRALETIHELYRAVNRNGITAEELAQAKNKIASRIVLGSERPMGRWASLGYNWMYRQEYRSVRDDLERIRAVTLDDVRRVLDQYPLAPTSTVAYGSLERLEPPEGP